MNRKALTVVFILIFASFAIQAVEPTVFSADGVIESTAGGIKFPDGSTQASAAYPASSQCTAITTLPMTITEEGVYCFTNNLEYDTSPGFAITINADNVTINMNDWTLNFLSANPVINTIGIQATERKNITIRNGTIRGFNVAIQLADSPPFTLSSGHLIEDIRIEKSVYAGIVVYGTGNTVRRNRVAKTADLTTTPHTNAFGIALIGDSARVLNNDVIDVKGKGIGEGHGLIIEASLGAVVEGNRIDNISSGQGGGATGINIAGSLYVLVASNRITRADEGINFDFVSTGKYMDNLTSDVTTPFDGGTPVGFNN